MDVGEASMETLRGELHSADAIIGVVTCNSLRSHWVAIELGAAWLREKLHPIRGPGVFVSDLPNPLPNITTAGYCEKSAMQQLLQRLATILERPITPAAKFELDEMISAGQQRLQTGLTAWFSLPPVMAAWRCDETRFNYALLSLCNELNLEKKELHICTEANGYICRDPEILPTWAKDHWKLSKMAVNQLLARDQDLLDLPQNVLDEQLIADLKRALSKRSLKRGELLYDWFGHARQWVVEHPPRERAGH
jgi:hypothetical protein